MIVPLYLHINDTATYHYEVEEDEVRGDHTYYHAEPDQLTL